VLSGNIIVALFCAFVPGIIAFAEVDSYDQLFDTNIELYHQLLFLVGGYIVFAFSSTMLREIIKDLEDLKGDATIGANTLPVVWGNAPAKIIGNLFGIILLGVLYFWVFHKSADARWFGILFLTLGVTFPLLYVLYMLAFAKSKNEFHHLSNVTKAMMLGGLLYLLVWYI
jgi:4-hydroxybenzoate polyprenyltransferase